MRDKLLLLNLFILEFGSLDEKIRIFRVKYHFTKLRNLCAWAMRIKGGSLRAADFYFRELEKKGYLGLLKCFTNLRLGFEKALQFNQLIMKRKAYCTLVTSIATMKRKEATSYKLIQMFGSRIKALSEFKLYLDKLRRSSKRQSILKVLTDQFQYFVKVQCYYSCFKHIQLLTIAKANLMLKRKTFLGDAAQFYILDFLKGVCFRISKRTKGSYLTSKIRESKSKKLKLDCFNVLKLHYYLNLQQKNKLACLFRKNQAINLMKVCYYRLLELKYMKAYQIHFIKLRKKWFYKIKENYYYSKVCSQFRYFYKLKVLIGWKNAVANRKSIKRRAAFLIFNYLLRQSSKSLKRVFNSSFIEEYKITRKVILADMHLMDKAENRRKRIFYLIKLNRAFNIAKFKLTVLTLIRYMIKLRKNVSLLKNSRMLTQILIDYKSNFQRVQLKSFFEISRSLVTETRKKTNIVSAFRNIVLKLRCFMLIKRLYSTNANAQLARAELFRKAFLKRGIFNLLNHYLMLRNRENYILKQLRFSLLDRAKMLRKRCFDEWKNILIANIFRRETFRKKRALIFYALKYLRYHT